MNTPIDVESLRQLRHYLKHSLPPFRRFSVDQFSEADAPLLLSNILNRVSTNTNALHEYKEAGMLDGLSQGSSFSFADATMIWESNESKARNVSGHYNYDGKIHVAHGRPSTYSMLLELAAAGDVPEALKTALHERIHAIQDPDHLIFNLNFGPVRKQVKIRDTRMMSAPVELIEAQAYRTANLPPHRSTPGQWVQKMLHWRDSGISYKNVEKDKLHYAVKAIDTLNALGFTIQEIAGLVIDPGKWNKKFTLFTNIEVVIRNTMQTRGLTDQDVARLLEAYKLEQEIDDLRIMAIARQDIDEANSPAGKDEKTKQSTLTEVLNKLRGIPPVEIHQIQ